MDRLRLSEELYPLVRRGVRALERISRGLEHLNERLEQLNDGVDGDGVTVDPDDLRTVLRFVRDDPALDSAPEDSPVPPAIEGLREVLDEEEEKAPMDQR